MTQFNQQILLKSRPVGAPSADDFEAGEALIPSPEDGQVLLKNLYLSIDPAIRGWMSDAKSYLPPVAIGEPVRSGTLSQIIESNAEGWPVGQIVQALAAWESFSAVPASNLHGKVKTIEGVPLPSMLSVLGGTGLTAYFGLLEVGRPEEGETVVVSAAAGGVGSIVGQIARIKGCRAVGLTGSDDKRAWLTDELGYDVVKDRVHVHDLQATILHLLGLDHERLTYRSRGRDFRLTDVSGNVVNQLLA